MPALTIEDLADALYCRGERPINGERVGKFLRHIESREQFDAALALLPAEVRDLVTTLAAPFLRRKGL